MTDMTEKERCTRGCIWLGAGVGVACILMFWLIAGWGIVLSIAAGAILGVLSMFAFSAIFCGKLKDAASSAPTRSSSHTSPQPSAATAPATTSQAAATTAAPVGGAASAVTAGSTAAASAPSATAAQDAQASAPVGGAATEATAGTSAATTSTQDAQASAPVGGAATEATAGTSTASRATGKQAFSGMKPSKELKGQQELSERKGTYKYEAPAAEMKPAKSKAKPTSETAATDAPAPAPAAFADIPADTPESKPETLSTARAGGADDLKLISGVGPKLEQTLNELGFYHFDQVAKWGPQEIAWVDSRLRFKGRIARDNWMAQAKTLAEGGETEFSARKKKT